MITSGENGKPLQPPKKASPSIEVVANWPILGPCCNSLKPSKKGLSLPEFGMGIAFLVAAAPVRCAEITQHQTTNQDVEITHV
jgi:hypothetical protein